MVEVKCPICNGGGVIDDGEHKGRCPFCVGSGVIHLDEVDDEELQPPPPAEPDPVA
jgi:DnaJ-class molecular chaperone